MQSKIKKAAIAICYLLIIGIAVDALLEWGYPRSNYSPGPWGPITQLLSLVLILGTGIPMLFYLWKKSPSRRSLIMLTAIFLTSTILLIAFLAPNVIASAEKRAKVQWYIDDLRSQGFNVVDAHQYAYHHGGGATRIDSYSEYKNIAKNVSSQTIYVHCGTPTNFIFFMSDGLQLTFIHTQNSTEYLYYAPYDPISGISLPK